VTLRAILGLVALNAVFLASGAAILWLVRGWRTWAELARLGGLAYLVGVAGTGTCLMLLLIAGVPLSTWLVLAVAGAFVLAAALGGRRLGRSRPTLGTVPETRNVFVAALGIALTGVFFEALFRATRLSGLYSWDAWAFWVPKAKAIYFYGGLDEQFFTTLPGAPYPPLVPVVDAAAFHFMGGPDVVTFHLQFWFLALGFTWFLAGVLCERVPAWILWPFVVLMLVAPRFGARFAIPEADFLLGFFFVAAAVLVYFWLQEPERWRLLVAGVALCGLVLTKREGVLLAVLLLLATLAASAPRRRQVWPVVGATAVVVALVAAPWRIWYVVHGVPGEGPPSAFSFRENADRAWPSLRLALEVLFDSGYWSVIVPVALGALVVAALARRWTPVLFFGVLIALVTLGGGWITWAIPDLPITQEFGGNPIVRYMGAAGLVSLAAAPLLLAEAWSRAVVPTAPDEAA